MNHDSFSLLFHGWVRVPEGLQVWWSGPWVQTSLLSCTERCEHLLKFQTSLVLATRKRNYPSVRSSLLDLMAVLLCLSAQVIELLFPWMFFFLVPKQSLCRWSGSLGEGGNRRESKVHTGEAGTVTAKERWKTVWSQTDGTLPCLCHRHTQCLSELTSLLVAVAKRERQVLREKCWVCQAEREFKKMKFKKKLKKN